jgi:glycosyltransferase involved in cell wall biosynthesis
MPSDSLVSCLMPTHGRRRFVPLAVRYFLRQSYPNRELVVVDDGPEPVRDLLPEDPRIRYLRLDRRLSIGEKRNRAAEAAQGALLAHWDDDDWSGPDRLSTQVNRLLASGADLCGLDRPLFYDPGGARAWRYRYAGRRAWAAGGTWLYRRALWEERPFDAVDDGEDTRFVWRLAPERVLALGDAPWFVALVHAGSTSRKRLSGPHWRPEPLATVTDRLGPDAGLYGGTLPLSQEPPTHWREASASGPRVTVAIPTFGPPTHLRQAVESVLGQTYPHLRVVVLNDGGEPPWGALAGLDDPRLVRFDLAENRGRYFADAVALAATPDSYFLVQDADDWSEPERVDTLLARLQAEDAEVVYAATYTCTEADPGDRGVEAFPALTASLGPEFVHRAHHPAALYCTEALRRIGGPFGGLRIGYDSLLVNLLRMTARVAFEPRPLTTYRMRQDSLTGAAETGFGSPERERAWAELDRRYQEARAFYERHEAGAFRRDTLAELLRQQAERGCDPEDLRALRAEAARLREALGLPPEPSPPSPPDLDALLADPRVPWSDWSVSRGLARALSARVPSGPARVLEVGSGVSTLFLALGAARGEASVTALEHDPTHFERTSDLLRAFGLREGVDLRFAPLAEGPEGPWYDADLDGPYDFVFADGPPLSVGRRAVLPALCPHLGERWTLWLKDGRRDHERACVSAWAERFSFRRRLWDGDPRGVWVLEGGLPEASVTAPEVPLVSCLMPTHGREAFVAQAVDYFLRQDYPSRELVVVDDGSEPVRDLLPEDPRVVYVRLQRRASTGAKRNLAAEVARGDLLVCWDDDDWFGPGRLSAQVEPLLRGEAEVTALGRSPFYCIPTAQFWRCTPRVHARMFFKQVVGGTLAYRRAPGARFPDASLAEDAALLRTLLNGGARLVPIPNRDLFVYVRHEANSWRFPEGRYLDRQGWHAVAPPPFLPPEDLAFYRGLRAPSALRALVPLAEASRQ